MPLPATVTVSDTASSGLTVLLLILRLGLRVRLVVYEYRDSEPATGLARYKLIVHVVVGEQRGEGVRTGSE